MYEFGRRSPVPDDQVAFWTQQAPDLLNAFVQHFAALSADDPVMTALQSEHAWVGGHLVDSLQLAATPQHIQSLMELWLANAVSSFATPFGSFSPCSCVCDSRLPTFSSSCRCSTGSHFPTGHLFRCSSSCSCSSSPFRALWANHCLSRPCPPTPQPFLLWPMRKCPTEPLTFRVCCADPPVSPHDPPQVSGPFAPRPDLSVRSCPSAQPVPAVESEFGPSRLTRFLEMPLDRYVNVLTSMINNGRFSHIGHAVIRLEGQTAWGVWLRINHWDSSQGRRARLRVGVLYHVANRTLSFHGSATAVSQLLLPIFQDWTYATLSSLPSVSQVGDHVPVAQCLPTLVPEPVSAPVPPPPAPAPVPPPPAVGPAVDSPGRTSTPSHRCQGCQELTSIVRRLTFQLQALQTEVHRMAAASARIPPSCPCPVGAPTNGAPSHASLPTTRPSPRNPRAPVTGAPIGAPPTNSSGRLPTATAPTPPSHSSPATFLDGLTCLRRGCTSQVPQFCSTGYCDTHCRSRRCLHHCSDRRFAQPVETRTSSSQLPPSTTPPRLRVCRAVGCHSSTHSRCRVGFCSNHCRSSRCRATRQPASTQPTCRRPHCSELVQPGCPVGYCNLHCTSPRCPLHDPLSLSGNGQGAARC